MTTEKVFRTIRNLKNADPYVDDDISIRILRVKQMSDILLSPHLRELVSIVHLRIQFFLKHSRSLLFHQCIRVDKLIY